MMVPIAESLVLIRQFLSTHPDAADWTPPRYLEEKWYHL